MRGSIDRAIQEIFPEYTSRRYSHWKKQYRQHDWESIPDSVAARISQVPNKYRQLGGTVKGPQSSKYSIPPEVEDKLKDQIERLIEGEHACMPRAEHVTVADVSYTLQWLCHEVNSEVDSFKTKVAEANRDLLERFSNGEVSPEELAQLFQREPSNVCVKDYDHLARKFIRKNQYSKQGLNTSGNYLSFDDERMKECLGF